MKSTLIICRKRLHGMAMVSAIFLLVALAVLGAAIAKISSNANIGESYDYSGSRAYQAARLGVEWGVFQVLKGTCGGGDYCALCQGATYAAPTSQPVTGLAADLSPYTVTVTCGTRDSRALPFAEGGDAVWVYQITATACNQPSGGACPNQTAAVASLGYSERRVSLTVTN